MKKDRWLWALLLVGAAIRLYGLGERSLSYDECQQFWASQGNVLVANREITLDPPAFAALLRLQSIAGRSEAWLRLLPCLLGILGIPAVYALAMRVSADVITARGAAFFFALAPYPIRYSQSLRVYSLTLLLCALIPAVFLSARAEDTPRRRWIVAALTCAGLLSMYGVAWLVLGVLASLAMSRSAAPTRNRVGLAKAAAAGITAALPFYVLSLPTQLTQGTPASFYEDKFLPMEGLIPALLFLARGTVDLFGFFTFIHPASGVIFGALAILGMVRLRGNREGCVAARVFFIAVAAAAVASALRLYPFGGTRQMLYAAPLFYVFAGAGIGSLRGHLRGWLGRGILAAIAMGCGLFLYRYHTEPGGQEMRPVTAYLAHRILPGDRILVNKDAIPQFRFYYRGDPEAVVWGKETVIRDYVSEANRVLASHASARWWLVFSHGWSGERRRRLSSLDPSFHLKSRFEAHRAAVYLFEPRGSNDAGPHPIRREP